MSFEKTIEEWTAVETKLHELNEQIKELRVQRTELDKRITAYADERGTRAFKYGETKIKIAEVNVPETLTFKYLDKCLSSIIKSETQVQQIITYIRNNREIKHTSRVERMK